MPDPIAAIVWWVTPIYWASSVSDNDHPVGVVVTEALRIHRCCDGRAILECQAPRLAHAPGVAPHGAERLGSVRGVDLNGEVLPTLSTLSGP